MSQLCGQVQLWCNLPGGQVLKIPNVTPWEPWKYQIAGLIGPDKAQDGKTDLFSIINETYDFVASQKVAHIITSM